MLASCKETGYEGQLGDAKASVDLWMKAAELSFHPAYVSHLGNFCVGCWHAQKQGFVAVLVARVALACRRSGGLAFLVRK